MGNDGSAGTLCNRDCIEGSKIQNSYPLRSIGDGIDRSLLPECLDIWKPHPLPPYHPRGHHKYLCAGDPGRSAAEALEGSATHPAQLVWVEIRVEFIDCLHQFHYDGRLVVRRDVGELEGFGVTLDLLERSIV